MWLIIFIGLFNGAFCGNVFLNARAGVPPPEVRIVGGSPTNISSHPFQVSLQDWYMHTCGGSIIAPEWVVTAAHCMFIGTLRYTVRAGSSMWAEGGTLLAVSKMIVHPQFNVTFIDYDYDVALLKLSRPQPEVEGAIKYIPLPPDGWLPTEGAMATVTGWGHTESQANFTDQLQEVQVPIMNFELCKQYYKEWSEGFKVFVTDRMLCAGFDEGGKDACQGDSGGPLVVDGYLTGLVSWGNGCGAPKFPGVYASVPSLLPWIKNQTGLP